MIEVNQENIKDMIFNNYNSYFSIRSLKKDLKKNIKITTYKEEKEVKGLGTKVGHLLKKLEKEGIIERYSQQTYKIIKRRKKPIQKKKQSKAKKNLYLFPERRNG